MKNSLLSAVVALALMGASLVLAQEPPKKKAAEDSRFPGFISELRKADLVVKVTLTGSKLAGEIAIIDAKITAVYQGKAKVNDAIQFEVDRPALSEKQKKYGDFGHLFYFYSPPHVKDATGIFLIQAGKPLKATAILADSELVGEYVKVARLPDADAAVGLVKLMCGLAYNEKMARWYPYDYPHLLLQDFAMNFKHLKTTSDGFRALLADRRKDTLKALVKSHMFGFQFAVWLTAHMEKDQRREALAVLLARYEENEKIIAKLEAEAKEAGKEKQQGPGSGIYIDPLWWHQGLAHVYLSAMELIRDPAWTRDTPQTLYDVLPALRFSNPKLKAEDVLAGVKAMVK